MSRRIHSGFTLVDTIVGVAIFVLIAAAVYSTYVAVYKVIADSRDKVDAIDLANEELELARNTPYNEVGIAGGLPSGVFAHSQTIVRDSISFTVITTVRDVDDPFDGSFPADTSPDDYKLVQVEVDCPSCTAYAPVVLTTQVSPKYLETDAGNGVLIIQTFDANGNPLPLANVHIVGTFATSTVTIDDTTNNSGLLEEVDAPPGNYAYNITVTKSGYTTDQTYATSSQNQNPTKPNVTVLLNQASTVSFVIDKASTMNISSVKDDCTPVSNVPFTMTGAKQIGNNPVIYKYNQNLNTGSSGTLALSNMEWDSYSIVLGSSSYELVGVNPLLPLALAPNAVQNVSLVVEPKNPETVLTTIKDSSSGLPVSGATVELLDLSGNVLATRVSGEGFVSQTDWSGGEGQATSSDPTAYFLSDGNVVNTANGGLTLRNSLGQYVSDGWLESSSFDTGNTSNFGALVWSPLDQPTSTGSSAVRFQVAANNDGGVWNFSGPDGTASTYYTPANANIAAVVSGNRYIRYKVFLHTDDASKSPNIADVAITFASSCAPPGQVSFSGISSGSYSLQVSAAGYQTATVPVSVNTAWQNVGVILTPQ